MVLEQGNESAKPDKLRVAVQVPCVKILRDANVRLQAGLKEIGGQRAGVAVLQERAVHHQEGRVNRPGQRVSIEGGQEAGRGVAALENEILLGAEEDRLQAFRRTTAGQELERRIQPDRIRL